MGIKQNGIWESSLETRSTLEVKDMINQGALMAASSWESTMTDFSLPWADFEDLGKSPSLHALVFSSLVCEVSLAPPKFFHDSMSFFPEESETWES